MGRRPKCRRVGFVPGVTYYKPAGIPLTYLEEVVLALEELEALRLKDIEDLEQEECARRMGISRPTFFRILGEARRKVADALVTGKAIRIEGGDFQFTAPETSARQFACRACGHRWEEPLGGGRCAREMGCPRCESVDIHPIASGPPVEEPQRCRWRGWHGQARDQISPQARDEDDQA